MFHIFLVNGLITDNETPVDKIDGIYLASASSMERAKRYIYSAECGNTLHKLGVSQNATLIILPETNIFVRIPVKQIKQVYTIEELRGHKNGDKRI